MCEYVCEGHACVSHVLYWGSCRAVMMHVWAASGKSELGCIASCLNRACRDESARSATGLRHVLSAAHSNWCSLHEKSVVERQAILLEAKPGPKVGALVQEDERAGDWKYCTSICVYILPIYHIQVRSASLAKCLFMGQSQGLEQGRLS